MTGTDPWNSDDVFGFSGPSAGSGAAVAAAPTMTATAPTAPQQSALKAITDPRGSAIFWITLAAVLSLGLVSGQVKISEKLRAGRG